jgi:uncharacterized damage-inducible protein DinB
MWADAVHAACRIGGIVRRMTRSPLDDAFAHHVWATRALLDACAGLTPEQLETNVPGTFGTIIGTFRHLVGADSWYRFRLLGDAYPPVSEKDEETLDLAALQSLADEIGATWTETFGRDPDELIVVHRDDGSETHATVGLRLAQVLHHGTDHRSQISTTLTQIGVQPPEIDLWAFGLATGRVTEIGRTTS